VNIHYWHTCKPNKQEGHLTSLLLSTVICLQGASKLTWIMAWNPSIKESSSSHMKCYYLMTLYGPLRPLRVAQDSRSRMWENCTDPKVQSLSSHHNCVILCSCIARSDDEIAHISFFKDRTPHQHLLMFLRLSSWHSRFAEYINIINVTRSR
jgi:hypothetical protein